jgi:hypothetical protein
MESSSSLDSRLISRLTLTLNPMTGSTITKYSSSDMEHAMERSTISHVVASEKERDLRTVYVHDDDYNNEGLFFETRQENTLWTRNDKHKLLAFDRLRSRAIEYRSASAPGPTSSSRTPPPSSSNADSAAFSLSSFSADWDLPQSQQMKQEQQSSRNATRVTFAAMPEAIENVKKQSALASAFWIHLHDLSALEYIIKALSIHPLV